MLAILLAAAVHAASPAAPPPPGICAALTDQIDSAQKTTSSLSAEEIGDNSAPRSTDRATRSSAIMLEVGNNLALMQAHHCLAYPHTVDLRAYEASAILCDKAIEKDVREHPGGEPGAEMKAACDRAAWPRGQ